MSLIDEIFCGERCYSPCLKYPSLRRTFVLSNALSDNLWSPFAMLASSPKGAVVFALAVYLVFFLVWLPLRLVSVAVGEAGTYALLCLGVYGLGFTVATYMSYPGSFKTVQRDIEKDYSRRLAQKVDQSVVLLATWAADLRAPQQLGGVRSLGSASPFFVPNACPDQSVFKQRHAEALWVKAEVLSVLHRALELVGLSPEEKDHNSSSGGEVEGGGGGGGGSGSGVRSATTNTHHAGAAAGLASGACLSPLQVSEEAASDAAELYGCLTSVLALLEAVLSQGANALAEAPNAHAFRSLHANLTSGAYQHPSSAPTPPTPPSLPELAEALFVHLGRLRLLAPRLRLRQGKGEGAAFPLGFVKGCLNARKPVQGSCACLDLMRAEVVSRFQCKCFFFRPSPGKDPNLKIDVCVIPPLPTSPFLSSPSSPSSSPPSSPSPLGGLAGCVASGVPVLLYCNPNAGMYECANMSPKSADWVDFYRGLGFQVVMFNYRGYGRSTGSPSPQANSTDALALVAALRESKGDSSSSTSTSSSCQSRPKLRVPRLALHGESIGGMVAAYAGRHAPQGYVDVLVCDRTFANLGAVAQYLVGGWTRPALKAFTGWDSNVVPNYALAPVPHKLCCHDVDDEIIAEPGSLKAGLALLSELGDSSLARPHLPFPYALAELLSEPPPSPAPSLPPTADLAACMAAAGMAAAHEGATSSLDTAGTASSSPPPPSSPSASLPCVTEDQIVHFAQCLRRVARQASAADRLAKKKFLARKQANGKSGGLGLSRGGRAKGPTRMVRRSPVGGGGGEEEGNAYTTKDAMLAQGNWGRLQHTATSNTDTGQLPGGGGGGIDESGFDDCSDDGDSGGGGGALGRVGGDEDEACFDALALSAAEEGLCFSGDDEGDGAGSSRSSGGDDDEEEGVGGDDEWKTALASVGVSSGNDEDDGAAATAAANSPWLRGGGNGGGAVVRAWWLCARVDGRCGQLLGHATAKGLPWVRSWVCSLLVWKGNGLVTELEGCDPFQDLKNSGDQRFLSLREACRALNSLLAEEQAQKQQTNDEGSSGVPNDEEGGSGGHLRKPASPASPPPRRPIREIKAALVQRGVDFSGCSERHELEDLLARSSASDPFEGSPWDGQGQGGPCLAGSDLAAVRFVAQFLSFLDFRVNKDIDGDDDRKHAALGKGHAEVVAALPQPLSLAASLLASQGGGGGGGSREGGGLELGKLIPLHCGHNAAFSDSEKRMLEHHFLRVLATWEREPVTSAASLASGSGGGGGAFDAPPGNGPAILNA